MISLTVWLMTFFPQSQIAQVDEPTEPIPPTVETLELVQSPESTTSNETNQTDNSSENDPNYEMVEKTVYEYSATVFRRDGSSANGKITVPLRELDVLHKVNGIDYRKTIPLEDIKGLTILEWRGSKMSGKEGKSGQYQFAPIIFDVTHRSGEIYRINHAIRQLYSLKLSNIHGETMLYTIFIDHWGRNDQGETGWKVSRSTDFDFNSIHPNLQSVVRIEFAPIAPMERVIKVRQPRSRTNTNDN